MPKITQVEPQKKNPHRFNIFLNGQFAFGADEDLIVSRRLVVGKEISDQDLPKILFESEVEKLIGRLYPLFTRRQRSEKEVRDYLKNLSFKRKMKRDEEISTLIIDNVVERLKQKGLINDTQFAQSWIEARRRSKKKGIIALKSELYQKGIDKEIINEQLSVVNGEVEKNLADQSLEKKVRSLRNLNPLEFKKKALEFLLKRGFSYEVAKDAVENFLRKEYNNS